MPTWDTAGDWDSATSESGVVHEAVANTDHDDADTVKRGYSAANPHLSSALVSYTPYHEDSGSTANDVSGNGADGNINGATPGATGLLGTTALDFDGSDYVSYSSTDIPMFDDSNTPYSVSLWFKADDLSSKRTLLARKNSSGNRHTLKYSDGVIRANIYTGSWSNSRVQSTSFNDTSSWHHAVMTYDGDGQVRFHLDATEYTGNDSDGLGDNVSLLVGSDGDGNRFDGRIWDVRFYDRVLSSAEVQTLYDVVATNGTITTDWRTV